MDILKLLDIINALHVTIKAPCGACRFIILYDGENYDALHDDEKRLLKGYAACSIEAREENHIVITAYAK